MNTPPTSRRFRCVCIGLAACWISSTTRAQEPVRISGIYPHLAVYNDANECGIGAVVPWADRLWLVTYAPHAPRGSSDKLWEITPTLELVARPESVGGTPANRMIHAESNQLFIGNYAIDAERNVRVIPHERMLGRPTGIARHLTDPADKVYIATMEEGLYEIDVDTLAVTELFADTHSGNVDRVLSGLPGYHGKGLYSGQSVLVYANNGEDSPEARRRPDLPSGCLASWNGDRWRVVRRAQFTDVTGPAGIYGTSADGFASDPIWSIGWDHRSVLLMVLDDGTWHTYRLPKGSHSYDGAHGWNTEWPRIRDVGEDDLLMTMHGTFWRFPREFTARRSAGIAPRSNYLKVVGDFCRLGDHVVLGCDDAARSEFLNTRRAKGKIGAPGQSNSNLWFVRPEALDDLGPAIGRGAVWLRDDVADGQVSDPFLFDGFATRTLLLSHAEPSPIEVAIEVDERGDGSWERERSVEVDPDALTWIRFDEYTRGAWVRLRAADDAREVVAAFWYANRDERSTTPDPMFTGLATVTDPDEPQLGALLRCRGDDRGTLAVCATRSADEPGAAPVVTGYYELDERLRLRRVDDEPTRARIARSVAVPTGVVTVDAASVLYVDDDGKRWRLPKGPAEFDEDGRLGPARIAREVATERDLLSVHGTIYELPARNAGGFAKVRAVASHRFRIHDFCSFRGLLVLSGLRADAAPTEHVVRSPDGAAAVWVGAVDDLWRLGRPRGRGGVWHDTPVRADVPSDPLLLTGFAPHAISIEHDRDEPTGFRIEVDTTGTGTWSRWRRHAVLGRRARLRFPPGFRAYWLRVVPAVDCTATATVEFR